MNLKISIIVNATNICFYCTIDLLFVELEAVYASLKMNEDRRLFQEGMSGLLNQLQTISDS